MPWVGSFQTRYTEFANPNKGDGEGVWCAACTVSFGGQKLSAYVTMTEFTCIKVIIP